MKRCLICLAAFLILLTGAPLAFAQETLVYSFETLIPSGGNPPGPDGFFGLGAAVTQEPVIGVTHLASSMKYDVGVGGFVGARTEIVPAQLNDPPGVEYVLFDLTLTAPYTDTFANIGVTIFGHALNASGGPVFGNQVQFADEVALAGLGAGTHINMRIDLDFSVGPYQHGESFNDIFGPGMNDLTLASAFQFYISKNTLTPPPSTSIMCAWSFRNRRHMRCWGWAR